MKVNFTAGMAPGAVPVGGVADWRADNTLQGGDGAGKGGYHRPAAAFLMSRQPTRGGVAGCHARLPVPG